MAIGVCYNRVRRATFHVPVTLWLPSPFRSIDGGWAPHARRRCNVRRSRACCSAGSWEDAEAGAGTADDEGRCSKKLARLCWPVRSSRLAPCWCIVRIFSSTVSLST
eukprot:6840917-Prymnesium_polylepis.1